MAAWDLECQRAHSANAYDDATRATLARLAAELGAKVREDPPRVYFHNNPIYTVSAQGDQARLEALTVPVDLAIVLIRACRAYADAHPGTV